MQEEQWLPVLVDAETTDHLPGARTCQELDELTCALEIDFGVLAGAHSDDVIRVLQERITFGDHDQIQLVPESQVRGPVGEDVCPFLVRQPKH